MFNGYHEPSATSYNDLELERGKKNQGTPKWACGNGTSIHSGHLHPQSQQSEIWMSKPPFIGLPNAASPKCNCPSCYQLPESQSYEGEVSWHRSWFARTYPVATHDLVKLPGNHHWENAGHPSETYPEQVSGQFIQESGEKALFYKPYTGLRHEIYQPGVISAVKKVTRKQDLPKQDGVMPNAEHHARYAASVSNAGYDSFRTAIDQRLIEERANYCNQNEKYINADSCREQGGLGPYGLNPNRRTILESFSKTVPSNANQNRVPSVGHRNIKDNEFHPCIDQNNIEKTGPFINHGGTDDKHCKTHLQLDVNPGQENLHAGLMNAFSPMTDYHGINLNRELPNAPDKDYQKFMNGRTPQYFSRNNITDVINRNPNTVLNYNANRKGVINIPSGRARAAQTPPKHAEIVSKSPNFGKDCIMLEKMSPGQKLMMNNNVKIPPERYRKGNEIPRSENILHGHITRPVMDANPPDKNYNSVSAQNAMYNDYRRPQEYSYGRRNIQRPYENPNGLINLRSDIPVAMNQVMPNFPDLRKGFDAYPRANNPFLQDGSPHQFEKLHYQLSGDNKPQSSLFVGPQFPAKVENLRETEKENPGRISHLEAIPYEELCKNGTSKISPLRLLRKKKLIHQKEDVAATSAPETVSNAKSASPPLDVRRFWATWAEEEEENVPQTQMVVLDCHNIDPEQAGLLHIYNPDNIRTVNLEDGNVLDVKGTIFEKGHEQSPSVSGKASVYDEKLNAVPESEKFEAVTVNYVKVPVSDTNIEKTQSVPEFSLGASLILDGAKETTPDVETKTNVIVQANHLGLIAGKQSSGELKHFEMCKQETKSDDSDKQAHSDVENPVLTKIHNVPVAEQKIDVIEETEGSPVVTKEESVSSYSSDDSQIGDLPTLPDLPTSEYRKNKFLDYSDDSFCNGGLVPEVANPGSNKESLCRKQEEEGDCHVDDNLKDFLASKPSEVAPGTFEIDDILKKLSDINFQGVGTGSSALNDLPDKHKTDKKMFESKKEKKTKKQFHKSSRTDQVTLQNISLTKPTIKFSIQKSHDLKISFKVLNNKKKHEKENSDEEEDAPSDEDNQEDQSTECSETGEMTDRLKKNKRRLITLKLKGVSEGNDEGSTWDGDSVRKSKKGLKKKKVRWERSPSPKTPVLKIKKSRYMTTYDCESEEVHEACNGAVDDASKSSEGEGMPHGDFQVHETVDSAKIKLTFKRNKNGGDRKENYCDNEDMTDVRTKSSHSEDELTSLNDSCLKSIADSAGNPDDYEITSPYEYFKAGKEDPNEESSVNSTVKEDVDMNDDLNEESGSDWQTCEPTADSLTGESFSNPDEDMMEDFKKEDIIVEPFDIVNSCNDASVPEDLNSPLRNESECTSAVELCDLPGEDIEKGGSEPQIDSQSLEVDVLAVDGESEEMDKNAEDLQKGGSEDEDLSSLSKVDDVTVNKEVDDKSVEDDCSGNALNCKIKESLVETFEIFLESKEEKDAVQFEEDVEVGEKSAVTNVNGEDEKMADAIAEEGCQDSGNHEQEDIAPNKREEDGENGQQSGVTNENEVKLETADATEQHECSEVDVTENADQTDTQNDADEPPIITDSHCDLENDERGENVTGPESAEQTLGDISRSPEQPKAEIDTSLVETDEGIREPENVLLNEIVKEVEDVGDVGIKENENEIEIEIGATDTEVRENLERQEDLCEKEQTPLAEQLETKEAVAEDNQVKQENPTCEDCELEVEDAVEENNNNTRFYWKESAFINRKILRRRSCEDVIHQEETNKKRVTNRSTSLNIELTIVESEEPEIVALDIAVSDIPLPPGDAPPENCLNFEEYFKSKLSEIEAKTDVKDDVKVLTLPQTLEDVTKPVQTVVKEVSEPQEVEPNEPASGESAPCDIIEESVVKDKEKQLPSDETVTETGEKEEEIASRVECETKNLRESPNAEDIRLEDLGVFGTRDSDITLEESSFRADELYECEGLAFDETLTITDDMEEEKVSDDDKFRNIMQNCLDNAKKFLSVGNIKLLSCSMDDLLEVHDDAERKKSDSHVSKDVLLTSCEESDDLILPNSRHQSLDLSVDFVPSFCPEVGSNPCSEILPVDNWPYLEEEVASSPVRSKAEDSDLLCCLNDISSTENFTLEGKFSAGKLKRQQRLSLNADTKRNARSVGERRRTIEGIGLWKTFRSTDEELSDAENIILNDGNGMTSELHRYSKKSRQIYDRKLKSRTETYSDSEGKSTFKRSSNYLKPSSWQSRVVHFRISKNNSSVLPRKNASDRSVHLGKPGGRCPDRNHCTDREKTRNCMPPGKERDHHLANNLESIQNMTRPSDSGKPIGMRGDGIKRKKSRFRNLHTKKRTEPQSSDQTKENKSTAYNGSNLVDSGNDSVESSPSSDPPKEIVYSHNKSTKTSSSADDLPSRKSRAEDEVARFPKHERERCREKRKRDAHEAESQSKRKKPIEEVVKSKNLKLRRDTEKRCWVCEVCGFSKSSERAAHIQSHPFHCQSCHLAFRTETNFVEHLTRKHKDIRNQHHCLLCELSFDLEKDYYRHLETREHKHLEAVEKNTINTLFRLLTGQPCPVLGPVESKPEWLPSQAGTVHFYHQATPLSLALQYLKLHHDKKKLSSEASE